jgi:hypothetical protein
MPNLPFNGLQFLNLTGRLIHANVKRHGSRLTVTVWGRMPLSHERRGGGRFIEINANLLKISASEFREPIVIEDAERTPCEILYEGFLKGQRDIECYAAYRENDGAIIFTMVKDAKVVTRNVN